MMESPFEDYLLPVFSRLVRNACVNTGDPDSGGEYRSAQTLEDFFTSFGMPVKRFECRKGRSNLLVRIPGTAPGAPSLMYMGHMDVVPAREEDWSHPPFSAKCIDGEIWGRGALDMLNMTASMAVGIAEAWKSNGPFPGDLCFLAVADEEASGRFGAQWLTREHWDSVKADYMITELGGFFVDTARGPVSTLTIGEKGIAWIRVSVKGTPGHGSMPYRGDNSIIALSHLISKLDGVLGKPALHPMYMSMARDLSGSLLERILLSFPSTLGKGLRMVWKRSEGIAKFLHTAAHTSVSPNVTSGGEKVNIIPDRAICDLDVRLLPGRNAESACREIHRIAGRLGIHPHIEVREFFPSNLSEIDTPLMSAVKDEAGRKSGTVPPVPIMIGGVTDGRFWRERGTTVYGYVPFDPEMTMSRYASRIHGIDERISLASLKRHLDFFTSLPELFFQNAGF